MSGSSPHHSVLVVAHRNFRSPQKNGRLWSRYSAPFPGRRSSGDKGPKDPCMEDLPPPSYASRTAPDAHLPGEEVWILGEERAGGEKKYYVCNLPPSTSLTTLVEIMKRRWACEHAHRELKQEVGLSHFEGRSWRGLCHHATLCLLALGFLQWLRLTPSRSRSLGRPYQQSKQNWPRLCPGRSSAHDVASSPLIQQAPEYSPKYSWDLSGKR